MRRVLITSALLALVLLPAARGEVFLGREQALRLACPEAELRSEELARFDEAERREVGERTGSSEVPASLSWWRFTRAGRCLGYACIDDVPGKAQPITFLVSTDAELRVRSVEILAYRETHGGEIRRSDWRAQFVGKGPDSPLRIGRDVRNIAGATISCRSLANGVRVRLELLRRAVARPVRADAAAGETGIARAGATPTDEPGNALARCQMRMGTTLAIRLDEPPSAGAEQALADAFAEVQRLEDLLSDWKPESELSALNRAAGAEPRAVSPELEELLGLALRTSAESDGAFDVSVGPLTLLWRAACASGHLPEALDMDRARRAVGAAGIELDPRAHRARLARTGMALDLGAIGKGYALDRAASILRERGHTRALLDFGGQLLALDPPRESRGWLVSLRDPRGAQRPPLLELHLSRASLATSSDDQQGATIEGRACSHICDPRSGALVEGRLAACALAPSAALADAWSTALYVLGPEGLARAQAAGLGALVQDGAGELHTNAAWKSALAGDPP